MEESGVSKSIKSARSKSITSQESVSTSFGRVPSDFAAVSSADIAVPSNMQPAATTNEGAKKAKPKPEKKPSNVGKSMEPLSNEIFSRKFLQTLDQHGLIQDNTGLPEEACSQPTRADVSTR